MKGRDYGRRLGIFLGACALTACGEVVVECVRPPCLEPIAVRVTVTSSTTGQPIMGAFVRREPQSGGEPCVRSPGTCVIPGIAGTYSFEIGAPGYQSVQRTVVVSGSNPECGCAIVETKQLDVSLTPIAPSSRS